MTPAERARIVDRQEFEAECRAARAQALEHVKQSRKLEMLKVRAWMKDEAQPDTRTFVYSGRPPALHTYNGVSRTLTQWASHLGISVSTLTNRRRRLGSFEAAIALGGSTGTGRAPTIITFNSQSRPLPHWAAITGLNPNTIHHRLRSGWSITDALTIPLKGKPGVPSNFAACKGTGAGSTAQESPKITFSEKA